MAMRRTETRISLQGLWKGPVVRKYSIRPARATEYS